MSENIKQKDGKLVCIDCDTDKSVSVRTCPYRKDLYGDCTLFSLCNHCSSTRAMDI